MSAIKEVLYLSPPFSSREELEREVEFWDASTAQQLADCPRRGEYAIRRGLRLKEEPVFLRAGNALHAGYAALYAGMDEEASLEEVCLAWGKDPYWVPPAGKFGHLCLGFIETIFKNYVIWRRRYDNFTPIVVTLDDLNLERVVAAVWRILPNGNIVLGESKVAMEFNVTEKGSPRKFIYSGKPDLPVREAGTKPLVTDFKNTNAYLSEWYFEQYRFSNQLRGYDAINTELLGEPFNGFMIRGVYMGSKAADTTFKGVRFNTYGPQEFSPKNIQEAIQNQYEWRKALDFFEERGYYPQHSSKLCSNCPFERLCAASPVTREAIIQQDYQVVDRHFLEL